MWPNENVIVGLSVRSIFDLLLSQKGYKSGSEIIMSGITIPDMLKIVKAHDLNVVPVEFGLGKAFILPSPLLKLLPLL